MQPPRLDPLPPGLVSLDDHQRHAAQLLDADRLAFFAGAAADGLTSPPCTTGISNWLIW